jgi:hypothetical protein
MRMLMHVKIPHEPFNTLVKKGTAGQTMMKILESIRPEAVYFSDFDGKRGCIAIVDVAEPSKVPALAEPFFLAFQADVQFHVVMNPDDLKKSGLDEIGKKWS